MWLRFGLIEHVLSRTLTFTLRSTCLFHNMFTTLWPYSFLQENILDNFNISCGLSSLKSRSCVFSLYNWACLTACSLLTERVDACFALLVAFMFTLGSSECEYSNYNAHLFNDCSLRCLLGCIVVVAVIWSRSCCGCFCVNSSSLSSRTSKNWCFAGDVA